MRTGTCKECGNSFEAKSLTKKYCSRTCSGRHFHKLNRERRLLASKSKRKEDPRSLKDRKLRDRYGITVDQYDEMVKNQNGQCKICKESVKLHVDHCHKTGQVRGLLCNGCNRGLGYFNDNIDKLISATTYLSGDIQ